MTTTTPANAPISVYPMVGPSAPGATSPDPVTVNVPPDSSTPAARWKRSQSVFTPSVPTSSWLHVPLTLPSRLVEGCGGLSEAVCPFTRRQVARGGDKEPDLHRGRQSSQVCRADLGPLRAVAGLIAGNRSARAGQPEPARRLRGGAARSAGHVLGEVVLHPHAMVAREHHCRVGRPRFGALFAPTFSLRAVTVRTG